MNNVFIAKSRYVIWKELAIIHLEGNPVGTHRHEALSTR